MPATEFLDDIAEAAIASLSLRCHACQDRHCRVDVVVDHDLTLALVLAMQAADVLCQRALSRDPHGQEQGVELRIAETLAQVAPGRQH